MSTDRRAKIVTDNRAPFISITTWIKREVRNAFEVAAHKRGVTMSERIRQLIEEEVAKEGAS